MILETINKVGIETYKVHGSKSNEEYIFASGRKYAQLSIKQLCEYIYAEIVQDNKEQEFIDACGVIEKEKYTLRFGLKCIENAIVRSPNYIKGLKYKPTDERLITDEENDKYYNIYRKSLLFKKVEHNLPEQTILEDDFKDIYALCYNLCEKDKKSCDFFLGWLAHIIQNPTDRLTHAIIFKGSQGTGKTIFCNMVLKPIFSSNFGIIGQDDLERDKNGYLLNKQFLYINEVSNNHGKFDLADKIKAFITDDFISVRRLYHDPITYENPLHVIVSSNHLVPIPVDNDDRRWSIFESNKLENGKQIYNNLKNDTEQVKNFLIYLLQKDLSDIDLSEPFSNATKESVQIHCENNLGLFYRDMVKGYKTMLSDIKYSFADLSLYSNLPITYKDKVYFKIGVFYELYKSWCVHNNMKSEFNRKKFTTLLCSRNYKFWYEKTTISAGNGRYLVIDAAHINLGEEH